jgi:hypothetical protein
MIDALPLLLGPEGYQISRSVRLRSSASAYFNRTPGSAGNQRTWTWSGWVKRGALGVRQFITMSGVNPNTSQVWQVEFNANNKLEFYNHTIGSYRISTQVFRDPSAWYHIVFCADTNNATAQNRFRCWVNGVEITAWDTNSTISSGYTFAYNGAYVHGIGTYIYSPSLYFDGYLTEINFIDGQALTPSSFGETNLVTGVWQPKKYAGTYGTNGFFLNFSDNSAATAAAIGKDYSGNGNNWTPNNISVTAGVTYDSMLDVPTQWADGGNGRGNYAVLNPLDVSFAVATIANGNLQHTGASAVNRWSRSSIQILSDKYYWEVTTITAVAQRAAQLHYGSTYSHYVSTGLIEINGVSVGSGFATWTTNDVIGVALDRDNNTVAFYKNGTLIYTGTSLGAGAVTPQLNSASTDVLAINFGQRPFTYTPPTGFRALNTQNLPTPTILKGNQYFDVSLYSGNSSTQNIVNSGAMQPDLVWSKSRSTAGTSHVLIDAVRGVNQALQSDLTNAEATFANSITAFNLDGFAIGSSNQVNLSGRTYVGWQWKEGPTQGFDIVTYTGTGVARTVAHSLGVAPKMMIVKGRSNAYGWQVYHSAANASPATGRILLNTTAAWASDSTSWNNTAPTSSVFSLGTSIAGNESAGTYVAYLFSEVAGFSRFGSYTGNGSADGPFCFTGFLPRWIMIKRTDTTANWRILDTARDTFNVEQYELYPNLSNAEGTFASLDGLSNGFKIRNSDASYNANGGTYIFAAFASNPFKNSLAR